MNNNKSRKYLYLTLTIACVVVAITAIAYILIRQNKSENQQSIYQALLDNVNNSEDADGNAVDISVYNIPDKKLDFAKLKEQNPDIYAWITIPDTNIDYPILQSETELDYYLDHNIDGSTGYPGCIYSQFINSKDFSDFNTVLYGHNMNVGTMFANLHYYRDSEFFNNHPYVYVYTENSVLVYQVFGAYTFSNVHLLMGFDLSDEEVRQTYIDNVRSLKGMDDNFNSDVEVTTESKLLSLSTCINDQKTKRYIVSSVLVAKFSR